MNNLKNKVIYLEILRILACFLVIINHTIGYIEVSSQIGIMFKYMLFMFAKIAVPIFFMISGYLLLRKDYSYKDIFTKKIPRILVPLIVCSLYYYLKSVDKFSLFEFCKSIVMQPQITAYWYLYSLIALYLITPFLRKMIVNFKDKDFIIFGSIILVFQGVIPLGRLLFDINVAGYFTNNLFSTYIGYYVIGYYLGNKELNKKSFIISIISFILMYAFSIVYLMIEYNKTGLYKLPLDNVSYITTVIPSLAIFVLCKYLFSKDVNSLVGDMIQKVGSATFGIYLFHLIMTNFLYRISIFRSIISFNGFLGLFCLDGAAFVILTIIVLILKKIPIIKNYL